MTGCDDFGVGVVNGIARVVRFEKGARPERKVHSRRQRDLTDASIQEVLSSPSVRYCS
jgi:hypothetical protein